MSDAADEQVLRQHLESWAANRVSAWCELLEGDYDFRSWAKDASKQLLQAGSIYEYARESRKLRCLLALMNPNRTREKWEMVRPGMVDGKKPDKNNPAPATPLPCSFENLDEYDTERALDGFLYCLCDLVDYLADNVSFGELFHTKRDELEKAFGGLDKLARVGREHRYFLPSGPIRVAWEGEVTALNVRQIRAGRYKGKAGKWQKWAQPGQATVIETLLKNQRIIRKDGSEVVALRIRWGDSTDQEIGTAMEEFARAHRPGKRRCKEPQRKGRGKQDSFRAALDCLSALRLASYYPKSPKDQRRDAVTLFGEIRLGGGAQVVEQSNFDSLTADGRRLFLKTFPFGESAENAPTWTQRRRMTKSGDISL
jgi:hypothetical protein